MRRADLVSTLLDIDEEIHLALGDMSPKPRIVIVGGAAFILNDLTPRPITHDIDVFQADSLVRNIIKGYPNVNGAVSAFADQIPYNFEDRLVLLDIGARGADWLTPSPEDLVVMKLYACRPSDVQDVEGAAGKGGLDWDLLEKLVYGEDEAKASSISPRRYDEMVCAFEAFKERWSR